MEKETTPSFPKYLLVSLILVLLTGSPLFSTTSEVSLSSFGPITGLADTVYHELDDCNARMALCLGIASADLSNYQITDNGAAYASGIKGCDYDTLQLYRYFSLPGSGSMGPYVLQSWTVDVTYSGVFNTMQDLVDSMNTWDPSGNWMLDATNFIITGGNPANTYSDLQVWHPTLTNPALLSPEDHPVAQGTALNLAYGSHQIIVRDIGLGIADTAQVYVSCTEPETIVLNVELMSSDTFCLDFGELLLPLQTVVNDCPSASGTEVSFQSIRNDSCWVYTGLDPGVDTACIIACDEAGICDTTLLEVTTIVNYQNGSHHRYDTLWEGESNSQCIDLSVFGGIQAMTIRDICPDDWGDLLTVNINAATYCLDYTAIDSPGTEDICIEVCDVNGVCDTTFYHVLLKKTIPLYVSDTILLYGSEVFCELNTDNLETAPMSFINGCPVNSGENVEFELDSNNFCVAYGGLAPGLGSACIYVMDSLGNVDTTNFDIWVKLPSPSSESVVLTEGDSVYVCIDTIELVSRLDRILNNCPGTGNAHFFLDQGSLCMELVGLSAGQDSACYIFCDEDDLCDTIYWEVEVLAKELPKPIAVADYATVEEGFSIEIDLCSNDTILGGSWTEISLLDDALLFGEVDFDDTDCSLTYLSTGGGCSKTEELRYVICRDAACDTTSLYIKVLCENSELKFYNGFSPNDDNRNDAFKIAGIEAFPNNTLTVYNRWGLQIFQAQNYQNDWKGTWDNQNLPDGVYFYLFDDGNGQQYTGYVQIHR